MVKNVVVILFLFTLPLKAQNTIDSLKLLLDTRKGAELVGVLNELAYEYTDLDNPKAVKYGLTGLSIAYEMKDTFRIVEIGLIVAQALRRQHKMDSAIIVGREMLTLAEKRNDISQITYIINGLGWASTASAQYDLALQYYFRNIEYLKISKDTSLTAATLSNIGLLYYKLDDFKKALSYYMQCLDVRLKSKKKTELDRLYINIGLAQLKIRNFSEAEKFVSKGLGICKDDCQDYIQVEGLFALGMINFEQQKRKLAEQYFLKSHLIAEKSEYDRFIFDNVYYLSRILMDENRIDEAVYYLSRAEKSIQRGVNLPREISQLYLRQSELYRKIGNYEKASSYQQKYIELRDSVFDEELSNSLMKIEADNMEKANQAKLASQNQILLLKEEAISRQIIVNVLVSLVAIISIVLLAIVFKNIRKKKMMNQLLELRVNERTKELELNRNELQRAFSERDLIIEKTAQSIRSSLASIKGICEVGLKDVSEPGARLYIQKIEETSDSLSNSLIALSQIQRLAIAEPI